MKTFTRLIALCALCLPQLACSSMRTIIADFDIDGNAKLVSDSGREISGSATKLLKVAAPSNRISQFPDLRYDSALFSTTLTINSDGIDGTIVNSSGGAVTFRFDQATISSNFQPDEIPLAVWGARVNQLSVSAISSGVRVVSVPSFSVQSGGTAVLGFEPSYSNVFPTKRLFGVSFVDKTPELVETGVGNTLALRVPIEYEGKRLFWTLQLTARATKVRSSYR